MVKEIKIFPVQQFNIDKVREIRNELNITAEKLSMEVSASESSTLIGNIESVKSPATYTDNILNSIAIAFTKYAKLKDDLLKKEYTLYDFYPEQPLSDIPQLKTRIEILENGPAGTIRAILENGDFFDQPRTVKEVTDYCNQLKNMSWKTNSFTGPLDYATKKGQLKRNESDDGTVYYQKA